MKPIQGYHSPDRSYRGAAPSYDEQVLEWARGLNEMTLRALAGEYLMGNAADELYQDAWKEFCRRFPDEVDERKRNLASKRNLNSAPHH